MHLLDFVKDHFKVPEGGGTEFIEPSLSSMEFKSGIMISGSYPINTRFWDIRNHEYAIVSC